MHFDFFYSLPSSSVVLLHLYSSRFNSYRRYFTIIYYYLWEQMEQKRQKSQFDRCKDSKWLQVMTRLEDERGKCKSWCNGECRWGAGGGVEYRGALTEDEWLERWDSTGLLEMFDTKGWKKPATHGWQNIIVKKKVQRKCRYCSSRISDQSRFYRTLMCRENEGPKIRYATRLQKTNP